MNEPNRVVAITNCPRTRACARAVTAGLQAQGWDVRAFEADGPGGRSLEVAIQSGEFAAVIELSLTELAAELLATGFGSGPERLTAAALADVPQIIVLGGLDGAEFSNQDDRQAATGRLRATVEGRWFLRTTPSENDRLGQEVAFKASAARGPVTIVIPRRGLSSLDMLGGPFWDPEADDAAVRSLTGWVSPAVEIEGVNAHNNDPLIGDRVLAAMSRY